MCSRKPGALCLRKAIAPISEITRRDVAKCFGDDLSGEQNVLDLVRKFFPVDVLSADFFAGRSLASDIERHMISNFGDWTVEYLFEKIGALSCSRDRWSRLIEAALHPLGSRSPTQAALVEALNRVLRRDGYALAVEGEESGYPIHRLRSITRGVSGAPKNLIFASNGPKPEASATRSTMTSSSSPTLTAAWSMTGPSGEVVSCGPSWSIGGRRWRTGLQAMLHGLSACAFAHLWRLTPNGCCSTLIFKFTGRCWDRRCQRRVMIEVDGIKRAWFVRQYDVH
jgi:hypothetical protein